MHMSRGVAAAIGAVALAAVVTTAGPATAATRTTESGPGWHWVHEAWQPAPQQDLVLPAARYCGSFDLRATAVSQDVRSKVLSRWDNGTPKDTYYAGPLIEKMTNVTTGRSKDYDMGGDALESDTSAGALRTYQTFGPVGVAMPIGESKGLPSGDYVLDGYHLIQFNADGTRDVKVALGPALDVCAELG
ncbi:hypothetical protein [Flexivirga oryzae]|uniref:Uncharacterized protein n=1 Tax=Flexivirga oryzae TaxID=1794944 RepID=A0A839N871_9MICO|nr:hypothetical protein [Flexivirga oryzae]MBB2892979.1 hypothetical protein [Flexivirga oryzae]